MTSKSSTATKQIPNPHPGRILDEEFLKPFSLSRDAVARALGVPPRRINEIVLGKWAITADTDLRLARFFGLSEGSSDCRTITTCSSTNANWEKRCGAFPSSTAARRKPAPCWRVTVTA